MPDRRSTKRWRSVSDRITRWCSAATSWGSKTRAMFTPTVNSSASATFTAPWTSYSATPQWFSKSATFTHASPWPNRRTPSRPKTGKTQIRTRVYPSTTVGSYPPRNSPRWRAASQPIWAVHGKCIPEQCTCCPTWVITWTHKGGWSGMGTLHWTHCIMVSTWIMGRVQPLGNGSNGPGTGSLLLRWRPIDSRWPNSYPARRGYRPPGWRFWPGYPPEYEFNCRYINIYGGLTVLLPNWGNGFYFHSCYFVLIVPKI